MRGYKEVCGSTVVAVECPDFVRGIHACEAEDGRRASRVLVEELGEVVDLFVVNDPRILLGVVRCHLLHGVFALLAKQRGLHLEVLRLQRVGVLGAKDLVELLAGALAVRWGDAAALAVLRVDFRA
jgi:hypothetical protein